MSIALIRIITFFCLINYGQLTHKPLILINTDSITKTYRVKIIELDSDKVTILNTIPLPDYKMLLIDTLSSVSIERSSAFYDEPDTTALISTCYHVKWFVDLSCYLFETHEGLYQSFRPSMHYAYLLLPRLSQVGDKWNAGPDTYLEIKSIESIILYGDKYSVITIVENTTFLETTYQWALGFGLISYSYPIDMGHKIMLKKYTIK